MNTLKVDDVRQAIADMLFDLMDIDPQRAMQDIPFLALHKDFDSLAFVELQLQLEEKFEMEFNDKEVYIPANVTELAEALVRHHAIYKNKALLNSNEINSSRPEAAGHAV